MSETPARARKGRSSLLWRLVATFLVLSVAMVAIVASLAYVRARDSLQESAFSRLTAAQDITRSYADQWVNDQVLFVNFASGLLGGAERGGTLPAAKGQVEALLASPPGSAQRAAAKATFGRLLGYVASQAKDVQELLVLDNDGKVVVSNVPDHEGVDLSTLPLVTKGVSGTSVQDVGVNPLYPEQPTMLVAVPLYDDTGLRQGILVGVLNLDRLETQVLRKSGLGFGGQTYVVDSASRRVPTNVRVTSDAIAAALAHKKGQGIYDDYAGNAVIGTYSSIDSMGAAVVSEFDEQQAFEPARRLAISIAAIALPLLVLLGFLIYLAARRIANPILAITRTAEQVRAGDLTSTAPVTTRDEVGELAETFNGMTQQLRENVEQLERRVDQRTAELNTQKRYFETLVDISPAAVVTMDTEDRVTGWNPAATSLFGYQPEEALGRPIDDLVVSSDAMRDEGAALARAARESGYAESITRRQRRDGTLVDVEIITVPLVVDADVVGSYAVYHDITELEAARRAADSANEAKSAFLATVSHEIRTPMNAIIGMGGLLVDTELDDEQREYAEAITGSGESLLAIINDILDFSKIEAGRLDLDPRPFDLTACFESALDLIAPQAQKKDLALVCDIAPDVPDELVGDDIRIRQIVLNLLSNAVKFTPEGSIVLNASIVGELDAAGRVELHLSVTDSGIGLTPDQQARLFQSFSQADVSTSRTYGGTGLGLAITKRLAEMMDGTATVTSPADDSRGSRFEVVVRMAVSTPAPDSREDPALVGSRVAVVEPQAVVRENLVTRLRRLGCVVDATGPFDLALVTSETDPASWPSGAPVVVMTDGPRRAPWPDQAVGRVSKPVKSAALVMALRGALGRTPSTLADRVDERSGPPGVVHPLRILLAEDNALNQKLALTLLARLGYDADVVSTGLQAVDAVRDRDYDLVLMDWQMPEMDGLEASRIIVDAQVDHPRIVALTANVMSGDREAARAAGMDDFLAKPLRPGELAEVLAATTRRSAEVSAPAAAEPDVRAAIRAHVREMVGGDDEEFEGELIGEFLDGTSVLVSDLEDAAARGDHVMLRRTAHTLKSHATLFGLSDLEDGARAVESAAAREDAVDPELVLRVVEQTQRAAATLAEGTSANSS